MVEIEVRYGKSREVVGAAAAFARDPRASGVFRAIARSLFASWWGETFRLEGARRGHPRWRPLSPAYAAYRRRRGRGRGLLVDTGHLAGSAAILAEERAGLRWGTRVPYAGHHQAPTRPGRPPRREILFVTAADRAEVERFVADFLDTWFGRAARGGPQPRKAA